MSREAASARVIDAVERGRSVVVVSTEADDRDDVLLVCRDRLASSGWRTVLVEAAQQLEGVPLYPLVQAGLRPSADARARGLAGAVEDLSEALGGDRTVVLVRDQHRLDPAAWSVLQAVQHRTGLVVVGRNHRANGPEVPETMLSVMATRPSLEEFRADLAQIAGFSVALETAARLHAYVDGRSLLARALVENAGWERRVGPSGEVTADVSLTCAGLEPHLERLLAGVGLEDRRALELLALLGPVDSVGALERVDPEALERLERRGLVEEVVAGGHQVVVRPPVLADHLRVSVPALRRRALLGSPGVASGPGAPLEADGIVRLLTETEERRTREAREAWQVAPDRDTAVELLEALDVAGTDAELHTVLAQSGSLPGSHRALVRWQELRWLHPARSHGEVDLAVTGLRAAKEVERHGDHLLVLAERLDARSSLPARLEAVERIARSGHHEAWVTGRLQLTLARLHLTGPRIDSAPPPRSRY